MKQRSKSRERMRERKRDEKERGEERGTRKGRNSTHHRAFIATVLPGYPDPRVGSELAWDVG
jgi:hypothetical protein